MKRTSLSIAVLVSLTSSAIADDGLYEGVFDPNSSFVRVVAPGQAVAAIDGETLRDLELGISKYVNVMPGDIEVVLPDGTVTVQAASSQHYSLLMTEAGETQIVIDEITNSPSKADVSFYNLTELEGIDLYVPQANALAISNVDPIQSRTISIRAPLTLDFELKSGDKVIATISQVELQRGAGVAILLKPNGDDFEAVQFSNVYLK